ncbi:MAG: universal stress protein, partial [Candidatus Aenigmarchaeota archaeon]|nr:universal stress protein [Candidatus Aenigmarchaeota archaeon]
CKIDIISVLEAGALAHLDIHPSMHKDYFDFYKQNKIKNLEKTKFYIESKGFKVINTFHPEGFAAEEIFKQTQKENYSLLIAGARNKKFFEKWLGSTSRKIVGKAILPVFISRKPEKSEEIKHLSEKKDILFAVDGNENSYYSAAKALEILDIENATVEILYVKQGMESLPIEITSDNEWLQRILVKQEEAAKEIIKHTLSIVEEKNINVNSKTILEGDPAAEIIKYVKKQKKDLIVAGSHNRTGISSLLLGSVSKRILDNVDCSVIIIPKQKTTTKTLE